MVIDYERVCVSLPFTILIHTYVPNMAYPQKGSKYSSETPKFYQNYIDMTSTADVMVSPSPSARILTQVC
jgi:hypothetical protein